MVQTCRMGPLLHPSLDQAFCRGPHKDSSRKQYCTGFKLPAWFTATTRDLRGCFPTPQREATPRFTLTLGSKENFFRHLRGATLGR